CARSRHARALRGPVTKERSPIDPTSLFSAPEGQPRRSAAASPPPVTNPFQAPDFGEDELFLPEDAHEPASAMRTGRPKAAAWPLAHRRGTSAPRRRPDRPPAEAALAEQRGGADDRGRIADGAGGSGGLTSGAGRLSSRER